MTAMCLQGRPATSARHICEPNHIHPFRDGNGRTMRFFPARTG
ncbi:MAG: Fic family protein [Alphaproteobacteria bacterium]|nr:Fic family protein [Alphaproteobacteria bacterium]